MPVKKVTILLTITAFSFLIIKFLMPPQMEEKVIESVAVSTPTPTPLPLSDETLWDLMQKTRQEKGLPLFIKDQRLCEFAKIRVQRAYEHYDKFKIGNHYLFKEDLNNFSGIESGVYVSENAGWGATAEEQMTNTYDSQPHRETFEGNWKYACVATKGKAAIEIYSNL